MAVLIAALSAPAPAQPQFDQLAKRGFPAGLENSRAVASGDVDGDGDLDLVVGNESSQNRLFLNDGAGNYTDATAGRLPAALGITYAVALADVDGDGDLDLFSANTFEQTQLYANDGTGTFVDVSSGCMPAHRDATLALAVGDVDGDGDVDVVIGNSGAAGAQNRLFVNDGSGKYVDATVGRMPAVMDDTYALALGDVDGDGDLDLVVGNGATDLAPSTRRNRLYLNDGTGSWIDASATLPADGDPTFSVALHDVDGDGDLDLVCGNGYARQRRFTARNRLYINNGSGVFTDATATRLPPDRDDTRTIALGDVDGDGDDDLVCGNFVSSPGLVDGGETGGQNRPYENDGSGAFTDATTTRLPPELDDTQAVALNDFDGDGDLDLVLVNGGAAMVPGQQNRLYVNDGTGSYIDATAGRMAPDRDVTQAVALGDVDVDGDLDVVFGNSLTSGLQNRLCLNDGRGSYRDATTTHMPQLLDGTWTVLLGDVDGDGDPDLVTGNGWYAGGQNRLSLNDGTGRYVDATERMPVDADRTKCLALGDVDGDGDRDLIVGNWLARIRLYLNDGSGRFTDATQTGMPVFAGYPMATVLGDVDGDGDLGLIFPDGGFLTSPGKTFLYLNDGSGRFTDVTAARMPAGREDAYGAVLGDVDGDGDLDLVLASPARNRLYLNNGAGTFADATNTHLNLNLRSASVVLGDMDDDGDPDLLFDSGLYVNNGAGVFSFGAFAPAGSDGVRAVGDVDGDADLDIVIGRGAQNRVFFNLLRQVDAPLLLRGGQIYEIELYARHAGAAAVTAYPLLGTAVASIPMPPFGTLGLDPNRTVTLPPVAFPSAAVGSIRLAIPDLPALVGVSLYAQALLVPAPRRAHLTNVTADVLFR